MSKFLRPTLYEVEMGAIYRYIPSAKKKQLFSPCQILSMYDHALAEILDLSDEGVKNVQAEARWLERRAKQQPDRTKGSGGKNG